METINIIMLSGKIGRGKSLVADYINQKYGFTSIAFANELKEIASFNLNWDGIKDEKGRELLTDLGQLARKYDKDIWIKKLVNNDICHYYTYANINNFIISDLRFKNELENIQKYIKEKIDTYINLITIRINGRNYSDRKDIDDISETELDDYNYFTYIINNNTTVQNVYNQVDMIMNNCKFKKIKVPELC